MANEKPQEENTQDKAPAEANAENSDGTVEEVAEEVQDAEMQVDETTENASDVVADAPDDEEEVSSEPEKPAELVEAEETITRLEEELEAAKNQASESLDRLQRTAAEFQNSKRRQEKVVADSIARASTHLIRQLLPVLDDLDLAFRNAPEGLENEHQAWAEGFRQIQKKLMHTMEEEGVVPMQLDGLFDPERHEAVSSEPNDEVESGHIIETLRIGYEHKERVLRPALVRVAM